MVINYKTLEDGTKAWLNEEGEYHREDGPAIEYPDGDWYWYLNKKAHRICGPSDLLYGRYSWYVDGEWISDLVREALAMNPDLPETVHLGTLAKRMLDLDDDRLWQRVKLWL